VAAEVRAVPAVARPVESIQVNPPTAIGTYRRMPVTTPGE
jgi:hypothetical protein